MPPLRPVSQIWLGSMALAQLSLWLGLYAPLKTLVPLLAAQIAQDSLSSGASKEAVLAAVTLAGSLVAVVATPLAGSLSDRSRSPWGRRSPWIAGGSLVAALGIGLLPQAHSELGMVLLWSLASLGLSCCLAALHGSTADRVPSDQQGSLWGWVGLAQPLGLVFGVGLCSLLLPNVLLAALVLAGLVVVANGPLLALERRQPASPSPAGPMASANDRHRSLAAFRHRPFMRLWISRFLLYLGWSISTVYLLYFLEDRLGLPLVLVGTGGMALACALMLLSQTLPLALIGASVLGLSYGTYAASHQALVVQHLPSDQHHGRDLGLFNGANSSAMVLSPVLAWCLVSQLGGYGSLFLAASILILISALPLLRLTD